MTNRPRRRVVLARHPPVAARGVCYGRTDLPAADPAAEAALASRLGQACGTVWTSPAQRCRGVAALLGAHRVDARLHELDFGAWEMRPWDEVPRHLLDAWAADPAGFRPPDGETGAELAARVAAFVSELPAEDHVIITHGGPLKVLIALLSAASIDLLAAPPPPGSILTLEDCR